MPDIRGYLEVPLLSSATCLQYRFACVTLAKALDSVWTCSNLFYACKCSQDLLRLVQYARVCALMYVDTLRYHFYRQLTGFQGFSPTTHGHNLVECVSLRMLSRLVQTYVVLLTQVKVYKRNLLAWMLVKLVLSLRSQLFEYSLSLFVNWGPSQLQFEACCSHWFSLRSGLVWACFRLRLSTSPLAHLSVPSSFAVGSGFPILGSLRFRFAGKPFRARLPRRLDSLRS